MSFNWVLNPNTLSFTLQNTTPDTIKIIWADSAYVDEGGFGHRIWTGGGLFIDKDKPAAPTVVPPGTAVTRFIMPVENIVQVPTPQGYQWQQRPLVTPNSLGRTVRAVIALQIGNDVRDYSFAFEVMPR